MKMLFVVALSLFAALPVCAEDKTLPRWRAADGINWCQPAPGGGYVQTLMTSTEPKPVVKDIEVWDGFEWVPIGPTDITADLTADLNNLPLSTTGTLLTAPPDAWKPVKILTEDDCHKVASRDFEGTTKIGSDNAPTKNSTTETVVVLTPTKLYDLIEALQKETHSLKNLNTALRKRVQLLEDFWDDANTKSGLHAVIKRQDYKISELERKVAGMQKQITILHAKKADK